jgi:hypothetical protein
MTIQSIFVLAAIVFAFALFATALAWGDFYTRGVRRSESEAPSAGKRHPNPIEERRAA